MQLATVRSVSVCGMYNSIIIPVLQLAILRSASMWTVQSYHHFTQCWRLLGQCRCVVQVYHHTSFIADDESEISSGVLCKNVSVISEISSGVLCKNVSVIQLITLESIAVR